MLDDEYRCAFADAAAARWAQDGAVFVRSSASHVFLAGDLVLRMAPLGTPQARAVSRSATTAQTLAAAGAPVPAPVRSVTGQLVEHVEGMVVTALPRVPGTTYEDQLTPELARLWGRTLAAFHLSGLVHGDPEPDNLVVDGGTATFVDLDDAGPGDPIADIAFALRAWTPPGGAPDLDEQIPAAMLAGYREVRPLPAIELARLPEAAGGVARRTLASYQAHLETPPDPSWPDWAKALHARIAASAAALEAALSG